MDRQNGSGEEPAVPAAQHIINYCIKEIHCMISE